MSSSLLKTRLVSPYRISRLRVFTDSDSVTASPLAGGKAGGNWERKSYILYSPSGSRFGPTSGFFGAQINVLSSPGATPNSFPLTSSPFWEGKKKWVGRTQEDKLMSFEIRGNLLAGARGQFFRQPSAPPCLMPLWHHFSSPGGLWICRRHFLYLRRPTFVEIEPIGREEPAAGNSLSSANWQDRGGWGIFEVFI